VALGGEARAAAAVQALELEVAIIHHVGEMA
jgi:hypothetical protein